MRCGANEEQVLVKQRNIWVFAWSSGMCFTQFLMGFIGQISYCSLATVVKRQLKFNFPCHSSSTKIEKSDFYGGSCGVFHEWSQWYKSY